MSTVKVGQVYQVQPALFEDHPKFCAFMTFKSSDKYITISAIVSENSLQGMLCGAGTVHTLDVLWEGRTGAEQDTYLEAKAELEGIDPTTIDRGSYARDGFQITTTALMEREEGKYFKLIKDVADIPVTH